MLETAFASSDEYIRKLQEEIEIRDKAIEQFESWLEYIKKHLEENRNIFDAAGAARLIYDHFNIIMQQYGIGNYKNKDE